MAFDISGANVQPITNTKDFERQEQANAEYSKEVARQEWMNKNQLSDAQANFLQASGIDQRQYDFLKTSGYERASILFLAEKHIPSPTLSSSAKNDLNTILMGGTVKWEGKTFDSDNGHYEDYTNSSSLKQLAPLFNLPYNVKTGEGSKQNIELSNYKLSTSNTTFELYNASDRSTAISLEIASQNIAKEQGLTVDGIEDGKPVYVDSSGQRVKITFDPKLGAFVSPTSGQEKINVRNLTSLSNIQNALAQGDISTARADLRASQLSPEQKAEIEQGINSTVLGVSVPGVGKEVEVSTAGGKMSYSDYLNSLPAEKREGVASVMKENYFSKLEAQANTDTSAIYGFGGKYYEIKNNIFQDTGLGGDIAKRPQDFGLAITTVFTEKGGMTLTMPAWATQRWGGVIQPTEFQKSKPITVPPISEKVETPFDEANIYRAGSSVFSNISAPESTYREMEIQRSNLPIFEQDNMIPGISKEWQIREMEVQKYSTQASTEGIYGLPSLLINVPLGMTSNMLRTGFGAFTEVEKAKESVSHGSRISQSAVAPLLVLGAFTVLTGGLPGGYVVAPAFGTAKVIGPLALGGGMMFTHVLNPTGEEISAKTITEGAFLGFGAPRILSAFDKFIPRVSEVTVKTPLSPEAYGELTPEQLAYGKIITAHGGLVGGKSAVIVQMPKEAGIKTVDIDAYIKPTTTPTDYQRALGSIPTMPKADAITLVNELTGVAKQYGRTDLTLSYDTAQLKLMSKGKSLVDVNIRSFPKDMEMISTADGLKKQPRSPYTEGGIRFRDYRGVLNDKNAIIKSYMDNPETLMPGKVKHFEKALRDVPMMEKGEAIIQSGIDTPIWTGVNVLGKPIIGIYETGKVVVGKPIAETLTTQKIGLGDYTGTLSQKGIVSRFPGIEGDVITSGKPIQNMPSLERSFLPKYEDMSGNVESYPKRAIDTEVLMQRNVLKKMGFAEEEITKAITARELWKDMMPAKVDYKNADFSPTLDSYPNTKGVKIITDALKDLTTKGRWWGVAGKPIIERVGGSFASLLKPELSRVPGDIEPKATNRADATTGMEYIAKKLTEGGIPVEMKQTPKTQIVMERVVFPNAKSPNLVVFKAVEVPVTKTILKPIEYASDQVPGVSGFREEQVPITEFIPSKGTFIIEGKYTPIDIQYKGLNELIASKSGGEGLRYGIAESYAPTTVKGLVISTPKELFFRKASASLLQSDISTVGPVNTKIRTDLRNVLSGKFDIYIPGEIPADIIAKIKMSDLFMPTDITPDAIRMSHAWEGGLDILLKNSFTVKESGFNPAKHRAGKDVADPIAMALNEAETISNPEVFKITERMPPSQEARAERLIKQSKSWGEQPWIEKADITEAVNSIYTNRAKYFKENPPVTNTDYLASIYSRGGKPMRSDAKLYQPTEDAYLKLFTPEPPQVKRLVPDYPSRGVEPVTSVFSIYGPGKSAGSQGSPSSPSVSSWNSIISPSSSPSKSASVSGSVSVSPSVSPSASPSPSPSYSPSPYRSPSPPSASPSWSPSPSHSPSPYRSPSPSFSPSPSPSYSVSPSPSRSPFPSPSSSFMSVVSSPISQREQKRRKEVRIHHGYNMFSQGRGRTGIPSLENYARSMRDYGSATPIKLSQHPQYINDEFNIPTEEQLSGKKLKKGKGWW